MELDSVQIAVSDLAAAAHDYELLLGRAPVRRPNGARRFQLRRGAVELETGTGGLCAMRFAAGADLGAEHWPADTFHGLRVQIDATTTVHNDTGVAGDAVEAIDHVVINSPDLDRAIAVWRDQIGLRLALDREFPKRGLRMLFFRSAGITLEFVSSSSLADRTGPDAFYGLAYRVLDLEACRARLLAAHVDVSAVRPGQKRDTLVATIRSGTAGVPTLLIEDRSKSA